MPDTMLTFGHHLIPLLSPSGAAGASGGKISLSTVKAACKSARGIHRVIQMDGRFELAVVPDEPDFFDPTLIDAKARNHVWETIRESMRLQWLIVTRRPEMIPASLPPTWCGRGFSNICIGYIADSGADLAEKVEALRRAPVQKRMVLLTSSGISVRSQEDLEGLDWVVFAGNQTEAAFAELIGSTCQQAGVAFLFHRIGGGREDSSIMDSACGPAPWQAHPFGAKIDLSRPTLSKLAPNYTAEPALTMAAVGKEECSATLAAMVMKSMQQGMAPEPDPESSVGGTEIEVVDPSSSGPLLSPVALLSGGTDRDVFAHLDGVVRRGLATFIEVGQALVEIRNRELWRSGGHSSWAAYCDTVGGLTKVHANRIIRAAQLANHIAEVKPNGFTPAAESQIRPLYRLESPDLCRKAWELGVERAGGQPTARLLSDVVAELMAEEKPVAAKPTRKQLIADAIHRIREAVQACKSAAEVESVISDLENLLHIGR